MDIKHSRRGFLILFYEIKNMDTITWENAYALSICEIYAVKILLFIGYQILVVFMNDNIKYPLRRCVSINESAYIHKQLFY